MEGGGWSTFYVPGNLVLFCVKYLCFSHFGFCWWEHELFTVGSLSLGVFKLSKKALSKLNLCLMLNMLRTETSPGPFQPSIILWLHTGCSESSPGPSGCKSLSSTFAMMNHPFGYWIACNTAGHGLTVWKHSLTLVQKHSSDKESLFFLNDLIDVNLWSYVA